MFRYLCPAAISKTHSCPHFLMKPQKENCFYTVFLDFWESEDDFEQITINLKIHCTFLQFRQALRNGESKAISFRIS